MTHIISVTNQKGGVGKTTTAINLAACLAASKRKTLLVDMDPQGNATSGSGITREQVRKSAYHVLLHSDDPSEVILQSEIEHLSVLPANMDLVGAEMELIDLPDRAERLALAMEHVVPDYEYIIIDAPPSLGLLTVNTLVFARQVLVPVQSEYYALEGLSSLTQTLERIQQTANPHLSILGLLVTMYDGRTNLAQQVHEEIQRVFGEKVLKTIIHRSVKFSEASSYGLPVIFYDMKCRGAHNYMQLCQEVVNVCEKA